MGEHIYKRHWDGTEGVSPNQRRCVSRGSRNRVGRILRFDQQHGGIGGG